jgi:CMP-N,N'-diacetyllegionaminic acid synthase
MTQKSGILGIVPARGGSKGLPNKNLKLLAGRSLIAHAADTARQAGIFDRLILSTDSNEIATEGRRSGLEVPFMRPSHLATDDAPMFSVICHAIKAFESTGWNPDIVVLLQPTSPLRQPKHLRTAVDLLQTTEADAVVSVVEVPRHLSPDYLMRVENESLVPFLDEGEEVIRRQDTRLAYVRDGTVYAFWRKTIQRYSSIYGAHCHAYMIPASASVTIDTESDWTQAERMLQARSRV